MARKHLVVYVSIPVVTSSNGHCSNDCAWMNRIRLGDDHCTGEMNCALFEGKKLVWDRRRKQDGYKRLAACRNSEILET